MPAALALRIHQHLQTVASLRLARSADAGLAAGVLVLKTYQSSRFARTYGDLLADPRYQAATQFFLEELYGPQELAARDAQFGRVVPALMRLFPREVVATVEQLSELHALSETLDDAGARHLQRQPGSAGRLDAAAYVRVWQAVGRQDARERQIALTLTIGQALDGFTRSRVLRTSLRMMRAPARAAGLSALQRFLEAGFEAFAAMHGAAPFLDVVGARERALAAALFDPRALRDLALAEPPLSQLP